MEHAEIARVAVAAAPYSIDKPYDYLIPEPLSGKVRPGVRVTVPFGRGNSSSEGIVLACGSGEKSKTLKTLFSVLDEEPVLDADGIALAFFLRQRCFCTMYDAVKTILPAGLWYRLRDIYRLADGMAPETARRASTAVSGGEDIVNALLEQGGHADAATLQALCGETTAETLKTLCKTGILTVQPDAVRGIHDKRHRIAELAVDSPTALAEADRREKRSPQRSAALRLLASSGRTAASDLTYYTGVSAAALRAMEKSGLIRFSEEEQLRVPAAPDVQPGPPIILNDEQETAYTSICDLMHTEKPSVVLLQGVTGSGKTEVYIRLVQSVLSQGRTAMVLVPEIVLTPQMMRKFLSYFGNRVVMLHSELKLSERYDQWKRIRRGEVDVVLGTRSAIFAPLKKIGLIILDEEQESSYQSENSPRYHARDVAKFLCTQHNSVLVLGSATPSVQSAWSARNGIYYHLLLRKRYNEQALPQVTIADLRQEIRNGNAGSISEPLRRELEENLSRGEQSILFLNRRGSSRMLLCGECGKVPECPRCSVPLTYHSANGRLMCHYCGHSQRAADTCPDCGGFLKHVGTGTQKVEEELRDLFPGVGVLRMDADTASGGHEKILREFEEKKVPILLGTQMVAKGLDFENVSLVGVLSADLSLYVDHYRAAERTFSLLTQVVGRAGRGRKKGRAVIQTYTPCNDVILAAAEQDYDRFYESEIRMRRIRRYPPFADLITFTVSGSEEGRVLRAAATLRDELRRTVSIPEIQGSEPEVLGPAPAPIVKVNNRFRYRCLLVGKNDKITREIVSRILKEFSAHRENRGLHVFADCNAME